MKFNKNKKRGVSLLETVVVVAMIGIIISILGPTLRYYIQLGEKYRYGIDFNQVAGDAFYKLEDIVSSAIMEDSGSIAFGKKTIGMGLNDKSLVDINKYTLSSIRKDINESSNDKESKVLIIAAPVTIKENESDNAGRLGESFHYFRFAQIDGKWGLYYGNTLNKDGTGKYLGVNSIVFEGEEKIFPTIADNIILYNPNGNDNNSKKWENYFQETAAGMMMTITYKSANDANSPATTVKKLFIKRGEI